MEELFDIVDKTGKVIGTATRSECHKNPALMHQVVHLHILDNQGRLYLQKRSGNKDLLPGYWDSAVGGHVSSKETARTALTREAMEELGINANNIVDALFLFNYIWYGHNNTEYVHSFKLIYTGVFSLDPAEVSDGRFFSIEEIESRLHSNFFTPNFEFEYANYLKKYLKIDPV